MIESNESIIKENEDSKENINGLSEEEILLAKENGFILIGKTGVGKTSLLNLLYGSPIGKIGYSLVSETKNSKSYYIKEIVNSEFFYYCIVDTPGLYDSEGKEADIKQKKEILELVSKEKIKIKGLLFLSNFQNERFDTSEQDTLIQYNKIFPIRDFWSKVIFIFTHYYGDPDGDTKEEIKENSNKNLTNIFNNIMNKIKNVSCPINFKKLNRQYVNIFSKEKNDKQKKNNELIKETLFKEIKKLSALSPLFSQIEIFHFKNFSLNEKDEFLYDCELILYLDSNEKIINKNLNITGRHLKDNNTEIESKIELEINCCEEDEEGNLKSVVHKNDSILSLLKKNILAFSISIGSLTLVTILGFFSSGFIGLGLIAPIPIIYKYFQKREKDQKLEEKKEEILEKQDIIRMINEAVAKFNN